LRKSTYVLLACLIGFALGAVIQALWLAMGWPDWSEIMVLVATCGLVGGAYYRLAEHVVTE
jgi:hypothetical protein